MNWKKHVFGLVAVMCTSLIAYGADRPNRTASASASATGEMWSQVTTASSGVVAKTDHNLQTSQDPTREAVPVLGSMNKSVTVATLGGSRGAPANDDCENAEVVTGPYPVTVCGTNVGSTIDCPGVMDWTAVWYAVDLPYAYNDLVTDYCPSPVDMMMDEIGIVYVNDCSCGDDAVVGSYSWYDCTNGFRNPKVWWRNVPGPATVLIPVYIASPHDFCIEFNVTEGFPCDIPCPAGAVMENEACGEDTNGGCNMAVPAFEPLTCGETICGTCWASGWSRDTDWFEITVDEPTTMTFTVKAEFIDGVIAGLMEPVTPGVVGCDQIMGSVNPSATGMDCEEINVTYNAMPGTYWWFVAPTAWDGMPCGGANDYTATMTCEPWELRGACCDDNAGDCTDNVLYQDCSPTARFAPNTLCEDLSPPCGGCPGSTLEIEIQTDRYPTETTWAITNHETGEVICSGGPYERGYWTYVEYCCIGANDCVDFTIYDLSGDGQWPPRGYAVRQDGVEMCNTIGSGWVGFQASCTNIGGGCEHGRCCYSPWPNCVETTRSDCISQYGGLWTEGLTCDDACQDPDAPDFVVVAPYTSPERSTCNGALNRCHPADQNFETPEHVYLVTIPYDGVWMFSTCQDLPNPEATWLSVGTSMCGEDIGWNAYACMGYYAEVVAILTAGDYYVDVEGYQQCLSYVLDIHEVIACDPQCPANSTPEIEPCGETTNNGCWMSPSGFEPITVNQTICGTAWADNWNSDNDWFEFVAPADDTMTFSVRSSFPCQISIAEQYVPGVPGCDNFTGGLTYEQTSECEEKSVSFPVTAGGTYYVLISYLANFNGPCGTTNDYVATLTGSNSECPDLDGDGDVDLVDLATLLSNYGGSNATFEQGDLDRDGDVDLTDLAMLLTAYGTTCP